jgi:hypothetical protein
MYVGIDPLTSESVATPPFCFGPFALLGLVVDEQAVMTAAAAAIATIHHLALGDLVMGIPSGSW